MSGEAVMTMPAGAKRSLRHAAHADAKPSASRAGHAAGEAARAIRTTADTTTRASHAAVRATTEATDAFGASARVAEEASRGARAHAMAPTPTPAAHAANQAPKAPTTPAPNAAKRRYRRIVGRVFSTVVTVSAVAVLVATLLTPVLHVYGSSMAPALNEGDLLLSVRSGEFDTGDVVAFYYGNKLLIKRCIAGPGDWVDIKDDGTVTVNEVPLDEPYITDKARGTVDIDLPYQVPDGRYFVMGDHRSTSVDSRTQAIGCIAADQVVGRVALRIWPLQGFGGVK